MPTTFGTLKTTGAVTIAGALTVVGAFAGAAISGTSGTFTGDVNTPTLEAQTVSGTTLRDSAGTFLVSAGNARATTFEAGTISGATLRTTAGDTIINASGVATIDTLSGGKLIINSIGAGSGNLTLWGTRGGNICARDSDNAGNTQCYFLDGAFVCAITTAACP